MGWPDAYKFQQPTTPQSTWRMETIEAKGTTGVSDYYARLDGPRDVNDFMRFYVNRYGAPNAIMDTDAVDRITLPKRTNGGFPGMVTLLAHPSPAPGVPGRIQQVSLNARGRPIAVTEVNPYDDQRNATTRYVYGDPLWPDFVTRIVPPLKDSVVIGYLPNGNRAWQQDARGTSSRVSFSYDTVGSGLNLLKSITAPLTPAEELYYDTFGNLSQTRSPIGFITDYRKDNIGRDTLIESPIDSAQTTGNRRKHRIEYELDRVRTTVTSAPDTLGSPTVQAVWVRNYYDGEDNLIEVSRWSDPDPAGIGVITTRWQHDAANRVILEVSPDQTPGDPLDNPRDSTVYDPAGNPIQLITRRGYTIDMQYDDWNRLVKRRIPAVSYDSVRRGIAHRKFLGDLNPTPAYPMYPNAANGGYVIAADSVIFEYDATGAIIRADNADGRVSRTYYRNGQLRTETQRIRTVTGDNFDLHNYTVEYRYDRNGRRVSVKHPGTLGPTGNDSTSYAYNTFNGGLREAVDALGNRFEFVYDAEDRLRDIHRTGGVSSHFRYDDDGRLVVDSIYSGSAAPFLRYTAFSYDARGKLLWQGNATGSRDTVRSRYSGLGHAIYGRLRAHGVNAIDKPALYASVDTILFDALGNQRRISSKDTTVTSAWSAMSERGDDFRYEAGTGRLRVTAGSERKDTLYYDAAGNIDFSTSNAVSGVDRASYFSADGKLRAVDYRTSAGGDGSYFTAAFEEHRYDAFGRRVLTRSRRYCPSSSPRVCNISVVRRTVWDGDQELYEIQMPGGDDSDYLENDTASVQLPVDASTSPVTDPNPFFGRVAYTSGGIIDQPLSVIRIGYVDKLDRDGVQQPNHWTPAPFAMFPLWTSRGQPELGVFANGGVEWCQVWAGRTFCVRATWPGQWFVSQRPKVVRNAWHGTLLEDKADASGQTYRRSRYYDMHTGRFTQEDPIGLAGGLNLYGFANGDPVNFSDPFGLCPVFDAISLFKCIGEAAAVVNEAAVNIGVAVLYALASPVPDPSDILLSAAAPFLRRGAARAAEMYVDDFVTKNTKYFSAMFKSEGDARALARRKIGRNPVEVEPGKWRSRDGKWQYRAKPGDVSEGHVHIEELNPRTGEVLQNWHLRWENPR